MIGELYIGGQCLVCGYLGCFGQIVECFVVDLFLGLGECLYCIGDLVCYCVDGQVEYFGWVDQQIKICGFCIEIGEIES